MIKIRWIGPDQYSPAYGFLQAGVELEVPAAVAAVWLADKVAEEVGAPTHRSSRAKESKRTED